ncbi:hypothetical protein DS2_01580 [Catenovulum agarivorans DS-2]|uniref:Transmembrane protein n=1 Tax=Catenovulum agarivorans DS-2 TaxID=1328313 RepID=W7QKC3_9ALTE|nr:DUF3025 domain-containing protein [Catenovulum agarivorans]EWH12371.1 hypothetical protein DS2_01580 [Catenovulum agarivorans DS-2]
MRLLINDEKKVDSLPNQKKWTADVSFQQANLSSGIYADISRLYPSLVEQVHIPTAEFLTDLVAKRAPVFTLQSYQFIKQTELNPLLASLGYEGFINQTKQIPTRHDNWHDLFNGLIWGLFPSCKQAINQLHVQDIGQFGLKQRTKQRDALTLFDECGVILAYTDEQQKTTLQSHQWMDSFWVNRQDWFRSIRPFVFGHAMYEMALAPFIGLTAKAYFVQVEPCFFDCTLNQQYQILDQLVAKQILLDKSLANNQRLSPLPLLGVPGWYTDNSKQSFYANTKYFRPKRQKVAKV